MTRSGQRLLIAFRFYEAVRRELKQSTQRAKELIQPHFEASVDPSDHVLRYRHASFLCGVRILPREVLIHELGNSFRDGTALAVLLDFYL